MDFKESGYQSLIVIMASKKYASFNSGKYIFAVESKFLSILSIVESYIKSKCRALLDLYCVALCMCSITARCKGLRQDVMSDDTWPFWL